MQLKRNYGGLLRTFCFDNIEDSFWGHIIV